MPRNESAGVGTAGEGSGVAVPYVLRFGAGSSAATCGVVGTSLQGMWTWPAAVLALTLALALTVIVSLGLGLVLALSALPPALVATPSDI